MPRGGGHREALSWVVVTAAAPLRAQGTEPEAEIGMEMRMLQGCAPWADSWRTSPA